MKTSENPRLLQAYDANANDRLAELEDGALVSLAVAGDDSAFEALMNRYLPMVIGFLIGKTSNEGDAEDLGQEIFLKAFRNLSSLRNTARFGPWLMRITRTRLIDYYRSKGRRPRIVEIEERDDSPAESFIDRVPDRSVTPGRKAILAQSQSIALKEIAQMGAAYQPILFMRLVGGHRTREIATQLGLKEDTVRARLSRGLKILRKSLRRQGVTSSGV